MGQLFAGQLPTKPEECFTHSLIRMGASARFLPETGEQKAHRILKRVRKRTHSRLGVLYAKIDKGYPDDHRQMSMVANILHQAADTDYFRENVFRSRE